MSTIAKLNPMIRKRRGERRGVLRELARLQNTNTPAGFVACATVLALNDLTRNPRVDAAHKDMIFRRIMAEYRANLETPVAAPELPSADDVLGATEAVTGERSE
jgi:hypothetical protein